jgi:hypothetical protein
LICFTGMLKEEKMMVTVHICMIYGIWINEWMNPPFSTRQNYVETT